ASRPRETLMSQVRSPRLIIWPTGLFVFFPLGMVARVLLFRRLASGVYDFHVERKAIAYITVNSITVQGNGYGIFLKINRVIIFSMISLRIREVANAKGITTEYQLQKAGNLQPSHAARLWRGEMMLIKLSTIDALCEALDCEPGDLIVRVQQKSKTRK